MGFLDRFRGGSEPERSAGGSRIYRHTKAAKPTVSEGDPELIDAIVAHIEHHIGEPETVFHEIVSTYVHIDVHIVPASDERPWITLVTSGMSEKPMPHAPTPSLARTELMLALPPDWNLEDLSDERNYWPVRLLKTLAGLPHRYETWLFMDHTVPNDDPPEPYAEDTELCCALLATPMRVGEGFLQMHHGDAVVTFLGVIPLYESEMRYKLAAGTDELWERLDAVPVTELIDPRRPHAV